MGSIRTFGTVFLPGISLAAALYAVAGLAGPVPARAAESAQQDPDATLAQADAAFDADDYDRALGLYESVLRSRPDDLQALRRTGLLLGWAGKPREAGPYIERALRLEPQDRTTARQLARVESWAGDYPPALVIYDRLVAEDPSDEVTAVERAKVLSWAGRLGEAKKAFEQILAGNPEDLEAKKGLALTLGWEGRVGEAEALYREIEAKDPVAGRLGLARVALWRGNAVVALSVSRAVLATDPRNEDARDLQKAALREIRPTLAIGVDYLDDSDQNRNITAYATASFHPGGQVDLDITAAGLWQQGFDLQAESLNGVLIFPDADGDGTLEPFVWNGDLEDVTSEWLTLTAGIPVGRKGRVTLSATVDRLGSFERQPPLPERGVTTTGGGFAAYRLATNPVWFSLQLASEVPMWTAFITENNLRWNHAAAEIGGPIPWQLNWVAHLDDGQITGGAADNDRQNAIFRLWRPFSAGAVSLTPRYSFRYLSYSENLNDGYFDPQSYISNMIGLGVEGRSAGGRFEWSLGADVGIEQFSYDAENTSVCDIIPAGTERDNCVAGTGSYAEGNIRQGASDSGGRTVANFDGRLAWHVTPNFTLEAYAGYTDAAGQTASGFRSRAAGIVGKIRF